ncbi:MAG: hypothetical protein M3O24_01495 [Thermoproteota archaeon]|nr:hypothetical protein [Thermoproteota archaeon]
MESIRNRGNSSAIATSIISHESIHLTLNKISLTASAKLDNLFGRSNSWENYSDGLGNLGKLISRTPKTDNELERKKAKVRRR